MIRTTGGKEVPAISGISIEMRQRISSAMPEGAFAALQRHLQSLLRGVNVNRVDTSNWIAEVEAVGKFVSTAHAGAVVAYPNGVHRVITELFLWELIRDCFREHPDHWRCRGSQNAYKWIYLRDQVA